MPNRFVIGHEPNVVACSWDVMFPPTTGIRTGRAVYLPNIGRMEWRFHNPDNSWFGRLMLDDLPSIGDGYGTLNIELSIAGGGRGLASAPFYGRGDSFFIYEGMDTVVLDLPWDNGADNETFSIRPASWVEDPRGGDKP
jgi:phage gp29-like protein